MEPLPEKLGVHKDMNGNFVHSILLMVLLNCYVGLILGSTIYEKFWPTKPLKKRCRILKDILSEEHVKEWRLFKSR